ncbi:MAG: efflux RND transporter permease subunit [Candidatus Dojkabacteria bacterium]|nr:MAG: efflux RND transporter permease subunit [Candidatus Dojkabacteria bacterium]
MEKALESEALKDIDVSYTSDPAEQLETQISSLEENAVAAIVTIFIILLLFIDLRSALILALFIPMTLGAVFLTFTLFGLSLNTISLFSLVLVLGLFVDDGTVVVEAIDYYKRKGHKGVEAVRKAIGDIGVADISGTLTTVLVFVPLVFIEGVLGEFIKILPITVIISLLLSLLIALTILPFISKHFLKDRNGNADNRSIFERVFEYVPSKILRFGEILESYVKFALRNRLYKLFAIVMSIVLIGVGIYFSSLIGFSYFAPAKDSEEITVSISFDQPTAIESARKLSIQVENILLQKSREEIEEVTYLVGNSRSAQLMVHLNGITEREITSTQIAKELNVATEDFDGAIINTAVVSAGPPETQFPFAMQIYSEDQTMLENATDDIARYIPTVKLDNDVEVADVKSESLLEVSRKNGDRYATIRVKFSDGSDSATIIELQNAIEAEFDQNLLNSRYPGVTVGFDSGQESDNAESFASVALAGIIALIVMYGLLVLQFNSFSQPLLILLAIPFCFPGLFLGLYLTGNPMSFFVVIGLTGLIGIVVNNTIMLIEYANARRREGKDITEAISEAVRLRTRPILTTTLTTVCGLVPLALTEPFWEPLAFTIIFGLLSSMALILFAFPVFYAAVQGWRDLLYNYSPKRLRKG